MPTDHVVATLRQTLLHKLAIQAATAHRLRGCRGRCATRTNSRCACGDIFQIRLTAAEQRPHNACSANASCARCGCSACIHFIDGAYI